MNEQPPEPTALPPSDETPERAAPGRRSPCTPPWAPPWTRGRLGRRRRAMVPLMLMVAAFVARRRMRARRPEVSVFVGLMFRPTTVVDVSLFNFGPARKRRRRRGVGRLLGLARR